jgi:hypothetical protein
VFCNGEHELVDVDLLEAFVDCHEFE